MRFWVRVAALPMVAGLVLLFPTTATNAGRPTAKSTAPAPEFVSRQMSSLPLAFTENRGQWDERVRFRASAGGTTIWFCRDGITYQFTHRVPRDKSNGRIPFAAGTMPARLLDHAAPDSVETVVVHAAFVGANPEVELAGERQLEYRCNYFLGNDPTKWHTDVPNYAAVVYRHVYPGVDVCYEGKGGALTCSYATGSQAALAPVRFRYNGFDSAHLKGNLVVSETGLGEFQLETAWGRVFGPRSLSESSGVLGNASPLKASPAAEAGAASATLIYSTYIGGSFDDWGSGIAVDLAGSAYVTGMTGSSDFPNQNPYDSSYHGSQEDVFVTKLSPAGNALVYSTYLGGSGSEWGCAIAVDHDGSAYVTGGTSSSDFPRVNAYDASYNGGYHDAFVTKLSPAGNTLVYSTYLGGSLNEQGGGIAVDHDGSAYVAGGTDSPDFPMQNPFDGSHNSWFDGFVTKFSPAGNALVYSTYLGGSGNAGCAAIAVDSAGSAYVTGWTGSFDFPMRNPYDSTYNGGEDVCVAKLSPAGNALMYSTFIGGSGLDQGWGIAVDQAGSAYVTGLTYSTDFPMQNPYDSSFNGNVDAFVTKLSPAGNALAFSTYLGGYGKDYGSGIAVDQTGSACVTGFTGLTRFFDYEFWNVFVTKLSPAGSSLVYSTSLGGSSDFSDEGRGIAADQAGSVYVTGFTYSPHFPTQNAFDSTLNGSMDVFVTKISAEVPVGVADDNQQSDIPEHFSLLQNYPNPFNDGTVLPFEMKSWSQWTMTIFNIIGQQVRTFDGFEGPGSVRVNWDGTDDEGRMLPSGIYFYRVMVSGNVESKKMVILK